MSFVAYFIEEVKLIILLMGTATRDSNRTFKTLSNRLWKLSQQYEGVNPGHENLGSRISKTSGFVNFQTPFALVPRIVNHHSISSGNFWIQSYSA